MAKSTTAYIGLGSNLGDREGSVRDALKMLAKAEDIEVSRVSELIETTPLGDANQPDYLNAKEKWAPRIIDLDLLLFGAEVINSPALTVPHPQIHLRSFVLKGLCQLNGQLLHPVIKEPVNELAARLSGGDFMLNPNLSQLVSVAGIIGVGKTTLTKKLSNMLGCKVLLEAYDTNPFMPDVYAGRKDLALDSQLYFLTHRAKQLNHNTLTAGQIAVSDYIFDKEIIYARRLLSERQLALYQNFYPTFSAEIAAPVLVIYLTDSVQKCLERIHKRNRPYEQKIEPQFMETLNSDYERLFANWKTCPVIRIQISKLSYTKDTNIDHLVNQIKSYIAE